MGAPREYLEAKYGERTVLTAAELQKKGFKVQIQVGDKVTLTDANGKPASCLWQDDPPLFYDLK